MAIFCVCGIFADFLREAVDGRDADVDHIFKLRLVVPFESYALRQVKITGPVVDQSLGIGGESILGFIYLADLAQ